MATPYLDRRSRCKQARVDNRQERGNLTDMSKGKLLIAWHSRTGASESLANAAFKGAGRAARLMRARDIEPGHLLDSAGYLFVCPENLASMSGEMKEMFDRCYYPVLGRIEGRAYATIIAAGSDGDGAQRQIDRIAKGWRLKRVVEPVIFCTRAQTKEEILAPKSVESAMISAARDIGEGLASGIDQGIF